MKRAGNVYYKRVIDGRGNIIGYIKKSVIYMRSENRDDEDMFWFNIGKSESKRYKYDVKNEKKNKVVGYVDYHKNIFMLDGSYVGTICLDKRPMMIITLLLILSAATGMTSYTTFNVMKKYGLTKAKESDKPSIIIEGLSDNVNWEGTQTIDIFSSTYLGELRLLYPDCEGTYNFVIDNKNNATIEYQLEFSDSNPKNIPMMFRLKMANCYVLGDSDTWLTIKELDIYSLVLPKQSSAVFELEWKWAGDDNLDISLGKDDSSVYSMEVNCDAWLKDNN